jgi:DNA ligase (NAD+)
MSNDLEKTLLDMEYRYYNSSDPKNISPDEVYDRLKEIFDSQQESKLRIGAPPTKTHTKKKLAFFMGSLDKIKPIDHERLAKWTTSTFNFVLQPKLDGVSAMYYQYQEKPSLYTRGDGTFGTDISAILPFLHLPCIENTMAIRGELVMFHDTFQKKYASQFKNSRNLVSGIINSKTPDSKILSDLVFIPYEILSHRSWTPSQQITKFKKWGFTVIDFAKEAKLSIELLQKYWEKWNLNYTLPTDGIVIWKDHVCTVNSDGNPDYAIAFKQNKDGCQAKVIRVIWNASKYNVLKPRIEIEPIELQSVTISFLTGFNAKYIQENQIGAGTILEVTRSGEVIPHILRVLKSTKADMPIQKYSWNETNVDIILEEKSNQQALIKKIHFFLKTLEIKNIAEKSIEKLVEKGFDSIPKLLAISLQDLTFFGPVESKNMFNALHDDSRLKNIPLHILMTASGVFGQGIGIRKIQKLVEACPDILGLTASEAIPKISLVDGWTTPSATRFMENLSYFNKFLQECPTLSLSIILPMTTATTASTTTKKSIVFSGFRDQNLEQHISNHYTVENSVTTKTSLVIIKDLTAETTKTKKAKQLGIPIQTLENFKKTVL